MKKDIALYLVKTMQDVTLDYYIKEQVLEMLWTHDHITFYERSFLRRYARLCHGLPITGHIITAL